MTQKLKVRIDGEFVPASPGQSVLQVARAASKYIPALCYMEGLSAVGACRLCMVEVQGVARLLPACTTPAQDGMAVTTTSPQLKSYRKIALELLFAERNHVCPFCVKSGDCELQALAYRLGIDHIRYKYMQPRLDIDASNPKFVIDHNLYWDLSGKPVSFPGGALKDWQARGHDKHSLVADPLFANPKKGDFRLKPGSPAEKIGFKPFDYSAAGVRPKDKR